MKNFFRFLPLLVSLSVSAQSTADAIIARELQSSRAYETLSHITDDIGARLTGSKGAAKAVAWTTQQFREWGIPVTNEPVMVPHWVRGREEARLVSPADHNIVLTAIGGSVATPDTGITADVIEVDSFDELKTLGAAKLRGKIVFYNNPMDMELVRTHRAFEAYRIAVAFRGAGASRAAEYGAKAIVIRSIGSASLRTPHTGALRYDPKQPKIPAAAMTAEDAMLVHRLLSRNKRVRMHMILTPRTLPDVMSANVIAEIRGSEKPEEIVLIGAHLDSWDLATGAIDDGSGVAMVMETMRLIKEMKLTPRRTIRAVLFMNEENGSRGGLQYAKDHGKDKHVAAIETDAGGAAPTGFTTSIKGDALTALETRTKPLGAVSANRFEVAAEVGADIDPLTQAGVPSFGLVPEPLHYFDYHHTNADTLDKVDPKELAQDTAAIAALVWILTDS
jgi:carboxypeptidase Q